MMFQIWGSFDPEDEDLDFPSTASCFKVGQTMPDGKLMLDFERAFAEEDGEVLKLLHEFEPDAEYFPTDDLQERAAGEAFKAFMTGWLRFSQGEPEDDQDPQVQ
jgi:hypothetical protein